MRRAFVDTPIGPWHYRETGAGEPLLLLHPTPYSSRYYLDLAPQLRGFRVVVPDLPGCGESCPLPPKSDVASLGNDVAAFMDAIGVDRAHVLAIHGGNKLGTALAADHPSRVYRYVFVGMTHSIILDREARNAEVHRAAAKTRAPEAGGSAALDAWQTLFDSIRTVWNRPDVVGRPGVQAEQLRRLADEAIDRIQSREAFDALYQANFAFDLEAALRRVKAPTLVVELRVDSEARIPAQAPLIVAAMTDARSITLPHGDRAIVHDLASEFAGQVTEFLRG